MSTRNTALEYLERELEKCRSQLSVLQQQSDSKIAPLTSLVEDAENEIEELQVKLKDAEATKARLHEQIENEKKELDEQSKELKDSIKGIDAALTEVRRAAGFGLPSADAGEDSNSILLKETPPTTPLVEVSSATKATPDVVDSATDAGVCSPAEAPSSEAPSSEASSPEAPSSVSSDRSKVSSENKCSDAEFKNKPPETPPKDKQPSAQATSSVKKAAAEIISLLQPPGLPSFEKRKSSDGPPKSPIERLKRRRPGFADLSSPLLKSGRQPKVRQPASQPEAPRREPLAELESVQPHMYYKKFGVRRKSCDEDSDVSWNGSDDDEEENAFVASEEEVAQVNDSGSGRRGKKKFNKRSGPTNELTAELSELVSDERCETEKSDEGGVEVNDKANSRSSSEDPSLDSLFSEKCVVEDTSTEARIAREEALPSEQEQPEVLPCPINEIVPCPPPPRAEVSVKKEDDFFLGPMRKWELTESPYSLAPLSSPKPSDPHPKLPGPHELGLVTTETTPQPSASFTALNVVSSEQPAVDRRAGSTERPLDPHEGRDSLPDPDDYRQRTLTWDILQLNPGLWAHLHTFNQVKARWVQRNDEFKVRCLHPNCPNLSHSLKHLRRHMFRYHRVKTYVCLMCPDAYAKKNGLIRHCKREHDGNMGQYWEGHDDNFDWVLRKNV